MGGFSLSDAWSECIAFIRDNLKTLLIVIIGTTALGWILQLVFVGGMAGQAALMQSVTAAQGDPTAMFAAMGGGMILMTLISYIINSASYFLVWRTGVPRPGEPLQSALGYALGAGTLWLLVFFVGIIAYILVVGIIFGLLGVGLIGAGGGSGGGAMAFLLIIFMALLSAWIIARFIAAGPAMAAAGSYNPFYGLATSWQLTARNQWAIFGYIVLLGIVAFVLLLLLGVVLGGSMAAMMAGGGGLGGSMVTMVILGLVIGVPITMLLMGIPVGVYRALAPRDETANIFT